MKNKKINNEIINNLEKFIDIVNKIPGKKDLILIIQNPENNKQPFVANVNIDEKIDCHRAVNSPLMSKLLSVFLTSGIIIIRQYLSSTKIRLRKIKTACGKTVKIPVKKVYGVSINNGKWYPLSKEEVKKIYCTDIKIGKMFFPGSSISFLCLPPDSATNSSDLI